MVIFLKANVFVIVIWLDNIDNRSTVDLYKKEGW